MAVISGDVEQATDIILSYDDSEVCELVNPWVHRGLFWCANMPGVLCCGSWVIWGFRRRSSIGTSHGISARGIAAALDAPLLVQRYSRLVIDCNRPLDASDAIPETSDTTRVPANAGLTQAARTARYAAIHKPFRDRLAALIDSWAAAERTILVAIHSFTPMLLSEGRSRPWHVGLSFNRDDRFSRRLMAALRALRPGLPAAFNQPYVLTDTGDYTIPFHAERRGLKHGLIEVRNDLIAAPEGQADWAAFLAAAIAAAERADAQNEADD